MIKGPVPPETILVPGLKSGQIWREKCENALKQRHKSFQSINIQNLLVKECFAIMVCPVCNCRSSIKSGVRVPQGEPQHTEWIEALGLAETTFF